MYSKNVVRERKVRIGWAEGKTDDLATWWAGQKNRAPALTPLPLLRFPKFVDTSPNILRSSPNLSQTSDIFSFHLEFFHDITHPSYKTRILR
tara:strand:+ start:6436 stop:6711 length:276 start_codon:yes stop_codon:yes gene_type:complete